MYVCALCTLCLWRTEKGFGSLELELQIAVSHQIGAGSLSKATSALNSEPTPQSPNICIHDQTTCLMVFQRILLISLTQYVSHLLYPKGQLLAQLLKDNIEVRVLSFSLFMFSVLCQIWSSQIMVYTSLLHLPKFSSMFNTLYFGTLSQLSILQFRQNLHYYLQLSGSWDGCLRFDHFKLNGY